MTGEVWLIANPRAGGGRSARHAKAALRRLNDDAVPCRLVLPASAEDSTATARQALADGARAVVACGGDGTVNAVLQAMTGQDVPLGIVAGGSGDDIAAALGMATGRPEQTADWLARALAAGRCEAVDVARASTADGTVREYLSVLCTGFDASVNERANGMARWGAQRYNVAMLRELVSLRPLSYRVRADDTEVEDAGVLVSVGNGPRFGGGMRICPEARLDDGLLDVTWLGPVGRATLVRVFPSVFRGTHVRHPAVRTFQARSLEIVAPGQVAYADGERIGPLPVRVEVRPAALRVLVAPGA